MINNYRPINLTSNISNIFGKLLKNRIYRVLDENQLREQAWFRRGYSSLDHKFAINQILEKTREYNIPLALNFIDYNKAFDSIHHDKVRKDLKNQGVGRDIVNVLKKMY